MAENDDRFVMCPGCRKPSVLLPDSPMSGAASEPKVIAPERDEAAAARGPADAAGEVLLTGVH